ncbi:MAG: class I SAM-dependent methyltransferase [Chloroherpetonaceae bacterium]|nr:class I SAM-dependent methyltransferase [Chloroherpetonaceae bacterium]
MLYLSREQISALVERLGQPEASILLKKFFDSYRRTLSSRDVAALYDDAYINAINNHELYLEEPGKFRLNIYHRNAFEYISKKLFHDARILDIGCGSGDFAIALATRNVKEVVGIDFSRPSIEKAIQKSAALSLPCKFICADVATLSGEDVYDFVLLNDVSEHLSDAELIPLLKKIRHLLSPRGELLIHTPNGLAICNDTDTNLLQMLFKLYLRIVKKWRGTIRTPEQIYYDQVHINVKSFRQLKSLLFECGFKAKVYYDDEAGKHGLLKMLSSNMLVVAKPRYVK